MDYFEDGENSVRNWKAVRSNEGTVHRRDEIYTAIAKRKFTLDTFHRY